MRRNKPWVDRSPDGWIDPSDYGPGNPMPGSRKDNTMNPLAAYNMTRWLMDPTRLQQVCFQVAAMRPCPSSRQIAKERRRGLSAAVEYDAPISAKDVANRPYAFQCRDGAAMVADQSPKQIRAVKGKVGVIPVYGPIDQRMSLGLMKAGGTSCEQVGAALDAMLNEASIGAIVLQVDSPGGSSSGLEELSDKIYAARDVKPIYAVADSLAASAAYWMASSASMLLCTPGGYVGSVGVYMLHVDESESMKQEGISVTMVSAGKYKTERAPVSPLSKDALDNMQDEVDAIYEKFCGAVARNRGITAGEVKRTYGEGRVLNADDADDAEMIDRVITFEELIGKLTNGGGLSSSRMSGRAMAGPTAEMMRLRHEHRKRKMEKI